MEKLDRSLAIILLGSYVIKLGVLGASFADAAVILVLAATHLAIKYVDHKKQITELNQEVSSLRSEVEATKKMYDNIKTDIAAVKIGQGYRAVR